MTTRRIAILLAAILLAPEAYWPIRRVGADFHAAADGVETLDAVLPLLGSGAMGPDTVAQAGATLGIATDAGAWTTAITDAALR